MPRKRILNLLRRSAAGLLMGSAVFSTGCQIDVGGVTLPSPRYLTDDVQYFPAGPEFQLTQEAKAMQIHADDVQVDRFE